MSRVSTRYRAYPYWGNKYPLRGKPVRGRWRWDEMSGARAFEDDLIPDDYGTLSDYHKPNNDYDHLLDGGGRSSGNGS